MSEQITLRQANQRFAKYIRAVEEGYSFVITRRGEPVARLLPIGGKRRLSPTQQAARRRSLERMRRGWDLGGTKVNRDELHER